jgi:hypothetical protein
VFIGTKSLFVNRNTHIHQEQKTTRSIDDRASLLLSRTILTDLNSIMDGDSSSSERGCVAAPWREQQQQPQQHQSVRTSPRDQQLRLRQTIDSVLGLLDLGDFEECNNNNGEPHVSDSTENQPSKPPRQHSPGQ